MQITLPYPIGMTETAEHLRLLIVDDNPWTRRALAAYLSGLDHLEVIGEASDGPDAIRQLELHVSDMVLVDCRIPRMTGIEATRLLKHRWPHLKVVVLTFYAECQAEAGWAGADAVIIKGCSSEELISTLRAVAAG